MSATSKPHEGSAEITLEELKASYEELRVLHEELREFLAIMSHELKNPLNLIQVNAQMLMALPAAAENPAVAKIATTIQRSVHSQARIIDDLLDVSRVRIGKLVLERKPMNLAEALQVAIAWAQDHARQSEVTFVFEDEGEPIIVNADPVRLEQVALNLLGNAIKFTLPGGAVTLAMYKEDGKAVLQVSDTGQGIDPAFLPHVFEMFKQGVGGGTDRISGGLGIGLSLVRDLVEMHGGQIVAQSPGAGHGATFTVSLPLSWHPDSADGLAADPPTPLRGMRVLCVDDSADTLESFSALMEMEGARVFAALSGQAALDLALREPLDLIISDVGMPVMDGYQLMIRLRNLPSVAHVPAIALTGFGRPQDAEHAQHAGFNAHLGKPVNLKELREVVAALVAR